MAHIGQFSLGMRHIGKGFRFFFKNKSLWPYAVIPTIINIAVLITMIFILIHYYGDISTWIFGTNNKFDLEALNFFAKVWHYIVAFFIKFIEMLIFLILLLLILITTFVFAMIITGPFNDTISEKTEQILSGKELPFSWHYFVKSIWRSIIVETQKAIFFLSIPLLLLFLNLIPAIGSLTYFIIANFFACFDIGFNFVDFPMSRKLWTFTTRMKFAFKNYSAISGLGLVVFIPFFPFIFCAPLVVGGTLLYNELTNREPNYEFNPKL